MEKMNDFDWSAQKRAHGSKYPWDTWSDGDTYKISNPADYTCKDISMLTGLRAYAARNSLKVRTKVEGLDGEVIFQFSRKDGTFEKVV